jgi:peptide/nickel transport system ATP-binding protein
LSEEPAGNVDEASEPILKIEDLTISYRTGQGWQPAVRDFSMEISPGLTYGLVGESGSGKTTIVLGIMRYLNENGRVESGRILLNGQDLLSLTIAEMRSVWGKNLTLVPQDPLSALNPSIRVGEQIAETLRQHFGLSGPDANRRAVDLLEMVHIADPLRVANSYPHQISGGMQQRVMIALALSTEPKLLVLDEPTTSLDVTTQAIVLDLVRELIRGRHTSALYVTHNLGVVAQLCDRVAVLYAGELVEDAATSDLFARPLHPYTRGLLDSVPRLGENKALVRLRAIEGQIPPLGERPGGCVFVPRCPLAIEICEQRPPLYAPEAGHLSRCHRWEEILRKEVNPRQPLAQQSDAAQTDHPAPAMPQPANEPGPVLAVDNLQVHFPIRRTLSEVLRKDPRRAVLAVNGVDLTIGRGQTLGLVGESGSGKTTLSRAVVGLVEKTGGEIYLLDVTLPPDLSKRSREVLMHLQMVFQNPEEALNPNLSVGESLRRPLVTLLGLSSETADARVSELLEAVRLPASYARRRPAQLSGGEKQRVAIARAFASNPDLLICDEPVSSLDVSVQASILNLLNNLQLDHENSILFISHNLAVVGFLADVIFVIYLGQLMQISPTEELFSPPYHPYTEALLSAIPLADPGAQQEQIRLEGELPSPSQVIRGCPFYTRCPRFLGEICVNEPPPWREDDLGRKIYCHIPLEELRTSQVKAFTLQEHLLADRREHEAGGQ